MTRLMQDVIARLEALPADEQDAMAAEILALIEADDAVALSPEQVAEIERRILEDAPALSEEETRAFLRSLGA
ncbi:MAG TPA: hypothetical protein VLA00_03385 [Xanthobacteraceae bacterium]|nr:hypothetical protein [Xanthobacteraceae bacterium]